MVCMKALCTQALAAARGRVFAVSTCGYSRYNDKLHDSLHAAHTCVYCAMHVSVYVCQACVLVSMHAQHACSHLEQRQQYSDSAAHGLEKTKNKLHSQPLCTSTGVKLMVGTGRVKAPHVP